MTQPANIKGQAIAATTAAVAVALIGDPLKVTATTEVLLYNPGPLVVNVLAGDASTVADATCWPLDVGVQRSCSKGSATHLSIYCSSGTQQIVCVGAGTATAAAGVVAPTFNRAPLILGTPTVGVACSFLPGGVDGGGSITRTNQWYMDGVAVSTATTYTPSVVGALTVKETATNSAGSRVDESAGVLVKAAAAVLPQVTTAAVITSAGAGVAPVYTNAASTSTPSPTITYYLLKNGATVASGASAIAAYTSTVTSDSLVIRAIPSNVNGTGSAVDSSAFVVTATAGFPSLSSPAVLLFGDSLTAHEHRNVNMGAVTFTRDGTTNLGRITAAVTNSGLYGTSEVQLVNLSDSTMEVYGRNNYPDSTTTGVSIHTRVADAIATRAPSFNPTTASTATQTLGTGTIIDLTAKSHRGTAHNTNALFGGGIEIIGNLGHPSATSAQMLGELAYAKSILAQYTNPIVFIKVGTNGIKGNKSPNTEFADAKVLFDGLTGLDGNGGNALLVIGSVPALGSTYAANAGYAITNEQWIGKCATSGAPGVLSVDATLYTIGGVAQKSLNRQYYEYQQANPSKVLFVDETTDSYDFTNQCMFDAAHPDTVGAPHTLDNTHYITNSAIKQAKRRHDALVAASVTFPVAVPRSSGDATTYNSHTRLANRGPWNLTTSSSGFNTGGSGNQPTGWSCGRVSGSATMVVSVTDPGDGLGMWVNAVCTPGAANDTVVFYPYTSSGVTPATLGIAGNDLSEIQMVCEVKWDTAAASGLAMVKSLITTASGGLYGGGSDGADLESTANGSAAAVIPDNVSGRVLTTGWLQMSNSSLAIVVPQIVVSFGAITGVPVNVSVRCVGINKR